MGRPAPDAVRPGRHRYRQRRLHFVGDHDVWRLPEADDALAPRRATRTTSSSTVRSSPRPPGQKISPNLAGRVAAAFALGAQVALPRGDEPRPGAGSARPPRCTRRPRPHVGELVTAFPHAYYPEDSWADDMEFGGAELARAGRHWATPGPPAGSRRRPVRADVPGPPQGDVEPVRHQRARAHRADQ